MNTDMNTDKLVWVLRDVVSGEPVASQDVCPENPDFPVEWNFMECYWCYERALS